MPAWRLFSQPVGRLLIDGVKDERTLILGAVMILSSINPTVISEPTAFADLSNTAASPQATTGYSPETSSFSGPTGTVQQGDATYVVNNGLVSFNGAAIGTINDAGDYTVTLNGHELKGNVGDLIGAAIEGTLSTGAKVDLHPADSKHSVIESVSDDEIRAFYATNPSQAQLDAKARELGLNNSQIMRATEVGTGIDFKTAPAWQVLGAYEQANHLTGTYARQTLSGQGRREPSLYAPKLRREVTPDEIAAFYATKPTRSQVFAKAAELGISAAAIPDATAFGVSDSKDIQFLSMSFSLNKGTDGYGLNSAGQVVSLKDPGAMYSSDPLHTGLDRYFSSTLRVGK